jgi:hypothetical protein
MQCFCKSIFQLKKYFYKFFIFDINTLKSLKINKLIFFYQKKKHVKLKKQTHPTYDGNSLGNFADSNITSPYDLSS